jgi:hypothetical protein
MLKHMFAGLILHTALSVAPAVGQEPPTEAGARTAVIALLRHRSDVSDSIAIVSDTAALNAEFIHCQIAPDGVRTCAMVEGKHVLLATVHLISPSQAAVEVRSYYVMKGSCMGKPLPAPVIGYSRSESFTLNYSDGRWKWTGRGTGMEC